MKLKKLLLLVACAAVMFTTSCKTNTDVITSIDGINLNLSNDPSVASTTNSFSIAVKADTYNMALEYPLAFTKANFDLALSISNLTAGDVSIQIYNNTKQMLYNGNYAQKISLTQSVILDENPTKIRFIFNTLSATFSCALTAK